MPIPSVSFLIGVAVLGYLLTFVVFAVLRVVTGVSIQRLGYFGLRRIAFSPRHGIRITIRGVGLTAHRPTFALPTWCSLVITELSVVLDLKALQEGRGNDDGSFKYANEHANEEDDQHGGKEKTEHNGEDESHGIWERLTRIKERIKRVHRKIHWLRLVDLVVDGAEVSIVGVGSLSIERATLSVDTRSQTVDRSRLFQHNKAKADTQRPAEWKSLIRSILFTPEGKESTEVLDYCTFNVHGLLNRDVEGLRDASIALKLGRLNVPYDDFDFARKNADMMRGNYAQPHSDKATSAVISETIDGLQRPEEQHERLVHNLSESRKFIASILRGIQEVQLAVSFFGLSRKLAVKGQAGRDVYFNLAMKEVGLDVLRLDSKSPAHRMYFSPKDVAHQGLVTAIAISAGIDDGHEHPERMVYIPMVTATVKTTLPSRTIQLAVDDSVGEKNTNILYANFVCTSPSIDLDPKHLPLVLDIMEQRSKQRRSTPRSDSHLLISRLLPKANVKLSIQEPVLRISLPPRNTSAPEGDFDLLISCVSSMSLDVESSHSHESNTHYGLASNYRHTSHQLYYQTAAGERHDLLQSDTVELKVDVNAFPEMTVMASGRLQTFTIYMIKPEISEGVRQIVKQLRKNVWTKRTKPQGPQISFLRRIPPWLKKFQLEGHDFGFQLASVVPQVSEDTRGFMLELESWSTEYREQREPDDDNDAQPLSRRRSLSRGSKDGERPKSSASGSPRKRQYKGIADGRRLAIHFQNLEGLIMDSNDQSPPESFMSLPQFEVAFSTSTDAHGPLFHINSFAKSLLLHYSLYNHFAIGAAVMVIKKTLLDGRQEAQPAPPSSAETASQSHLSVPGSPLTMEQVAQTEITTIDIKVALLQLKASLPSDPPMMLQVFGIDAGHHRWATPFFRSKLARLYVRAPSTKSVWSRVVTVKTLRLDVRDMKRRAGKHTISEKSIDVSTENIRIGVPHSLIVHNIFDNIANVIKATKQLQHHFVTGTDEYILAKEPEGPKHVPRISLRTQIFLFEIEDSSFDWKLGAIYRAGLAEQKQRMAREDVFRMKEKRLSKPQRNGSSRLRAQSVHPDGERSRARTKVRDVTKRRSLSTQPNDRHGSERQNVRYDTDGKCGISDTSQLTIKQARERLHKLNAQTWKARIDRIIDAQRSAVRDIRRVFWGSDRLPEEAEQHEPILALSQRPGLLSVLMSDLSVTIDKPSFPINEFPRFLHDIGKGMPYDMKYGMTIPMSIQVTTGEARFQLRDYPLPLLHVPALANGQSPRLPSLSLKTDFVIAEEYRDIESQRSVDVMIVPPEKMACGRKEGYAINVRRTISPVKTYSDMKFVIHTSQATRFTWGSSYQPALQDTMQIIEGFTKPPVDPSDRVGFWDKIRLGFHSRVNISWKGDGDLHLCLKGSRDPYVVTGEGAGLVMVWRHDVEWNIGRDPDPRKFMTVDSGDYILAIPDFDNYARHMADNENHDDGASSISTRDKRDAVFKKVIMKLSGNVRWLAGLMFERDLPDGTRSFDFKPHYNVVFKHPDFAKAPDGGVYDAFQDFRSQHIHMSIAIAAPQDRDWSVSNLKPSSNYNSMHLTPRFFAHFFSWWRMFSGVMALPVRQGPLWGVMQKKSKKFGRHIATIKYNLLLSPLFISHIYKHKDAEDYKEEVVSATGLKMKLDSFMLDLHQRRENFDIQGHAGAESKRSSAMKINQAQLDFIAADLRAVSASIKGTTCDDIDGATDETLASLHGQTPTVDISKFTIPDNDFGWIDMDDFVELDWILPAESDPATSILPLGCAPRFTYFRQTDHGDSVAGDTTRSSPFGDEPTHYCVMSAKNDPRRVQSELIEKRLQQLREQKEENQRAIGDQELATIRSSPNNSENKNKLDLLKRNGETLQRKFEFLQKLQNELTDRLRHDDPTAVPGLETNEEFFEAHENARAFDPELVELDSAPLADYSSDFNNRFIVHNPQIKWNNSLRNIILRYIHQNSQRRGFVYYMSRRAVKFILDILEEQKKADAMSAKRRRESVNTPHTPFSPDADDETMVQDRIEQLLRDGRDIVNADEPASDRSESKTEGAGPSDDIAIEYTTQNSYHFRLIALQIQLQSEKNPQSVLLVTAKGMQMKVVQIMDKDRVDDDVSGLVQRRFTAAMDSLQMFTTSSKTFSTEYLHMYSGNRYGAKAGSFWPPWAPLEVMFEFQSNPYGFDRIVHRTSASLRYDKNNTLRLKYNDDVSGGLDTDTSHHKDEDAESRLDHVWLEFPHFRCICDSEQYFTMYIIVMDLLLYNEPLEKTRSERLEKIMLASDFSDLTGAPEMVEMLQERIRQLEEIKMHFQVNEKFLDRQGWKDRIVIDRDSTNCADELFFMLKAITTSQQRAEDKRDQEHATGVLHIHMSARDIAWHLIRGKDESLMEFQLKDASFDRTDYNDGSNYNCMEIDRMNGFNLLPDALYPQIIGPFIDPSKGYAELGDTKMLRVQWLMLEAIAGIPVVDYFEIDLVPLKLQVERDVAKKLFEYIFPGVGGNAFDGGGFSPFMVKNALPKQDEEDEDESKTGQATPTNLSETTSPDPGHADGHGVGSLERRLAPTLHLPKHREKQKPEGKGLGISGAHQGLHGFSIFQHSDKSRNHVPPRSAASRQALGASNLSPMVRSASERSLATMRSDSGSAETEKNGKRFAINRSNSDDGKKKKKKEERSDDLTQMLNRASNYMTLAYVKLPSMVLCLSYKGKGQRNIEDVHDLVFRMPTLEYRNKTWSNLDLALQLKKDVIKALISHAGAIVGNKFSHHKPNRQQVSRLRELANMSTILSKNSSSLASETSSVRDPSPSSYTGRPSTASGTVSFVGSGTNTPTSSGTGTWSRPATSGAYSNGHSPSNGSSSQVATPKRSASIAEPTRSSDAQAKDGKEGKDSPETLQPVDSRRRLAPLARRVSGFGQKLKGTDTPTTEETEEKRKSKLLLGGQKLFRTLRD